MKDTWEDGRRRSPWAEIVGEKGLEEREDEQFNFALAHRSIRKYFITKRGISGDCNYNSWHVVGSWVIMGSF